jgi:hypothetical protein
MTPKYAVKSARQHMRTEGLGANLYLTGAFCGCATKSLKKFSSDASAFFGRQHPTLAPFIAPRVRLKTLNLYLLLVHLSYTGVGYFEE